MHTWTEKKGPMIWTVVSSSWEGGEAPCSGSFMIEPVTLCSSRTFCPPLPMMRPTWLDGTRISTVRRTSSVPATKPSSRIFSKMRYWACKSHTYYLTKCLTCEIRCSNSSDYVDFCILKCDIMEFGRYVPSAALILIQFHQKLATIQLVKKFTAFGAWFINMRTRLDPFLNQMTSAHPKPV